MAAILDLELDLPLADTPASRFLAWIAGGLVCLAVLAFALAAAGNGTARRIAAEPVVVTVSVPAPGDRAMSDAELEGVSHALRDLPGTTLVRIVASQELGRLVQPWIGSDGALLGLPLPRLLEVVFAPGVRPDRTALLARLAASAPGATVDPEPADAVDAGRAARALLVLGLAAATLILLAMVGVVIVVTRMSLDLHQQTVDLLRLMGASEDYVGRQFEQHALANALRGGLIGAAAAVALLGAYAIVPPALPDLGLPLLRLGASDWLLLCCVPVAGALLTAVVARHTARWGLARLR